MVVLSLTRFILSLILLFILFLVVNKFSIDRKSEKSGEEKVKLTLPNEILSALDRYIDSTRFHYLYLYH